MQILTVCLLSVLFPVIVSRMCKQSVRVAFLDHDKRSKDEGCRCPGQHQENFDAEYATVQTCSEPRRYVSTFMSPGCRCKQGYFRSKYGGCVTLLRCKQEGEWATSESLADGDCYMQNEEYVAGGNTCSGSCYTPFPSCHGKPHSKCQCKKGFYMGPEGKCVSQSECERLGIWPKELPKEFVEPEKCDKANEVYTENGTLCPPSCREPFKKCDAPPVAGCMCRKNYYRTAKGTCISEADCKRYGMWQKSKTPYCKSGEEFRENTRERARSCADPEPRYRLRKPVSECRCKDGLYRDPQGNCITEELCFQKEWWKSGKCTKPNQKYTYGSADCPNTCSIPQNNACHKMIVPGCICKNGFYMTPKGNCVTQQECEKLGLWPKPTASVVGKFANGPKEEKQALKNQGVCSGPNEEYTNGCLKSCYKPYKTCPSITTGCHCVQGFYRDPEGNCVAKAECRDRGIWKNKEKKCASKKETLMAKTCEGTCEGLNLVKQNCLSKALTKCWCRKGYYRTEGGDCVRKHEC